MERSRWMFRCSPRRPVLPLVRALAFFILSLREVARVVHRVRHLTMLILNLIHLCPWTRWLNSVFRIPTPCKPGAEASFEQQYMTEVCYWEYSAWMPCVAERGEP